MPITMFLSSRSFLNTLATSSLTLVLAASAGAVAPGAQAPDFKATDSTGQTQTLSQYRGKYVVLEWANQGCPYDQKHYLSGNMEALQKKWTSKGIAWLSVISSAPGQQGYVSASERTAYLKKMNAAPTAAILDPRGEGGRRYSPKTTPHMFGIDPSVILIFPGAITKT